MKTVTPTPPQKKVCLLSLLSLKKSGAVSTFYEKRNEKKYTHLCVLRAASLKKHTTTTIFYVYNSRSVVMVCKSVLCEMEIRCQYMACSPSSYIHICFGFSGRVSFSSYIRHIHACVFYIFGGMVRFSFQRRLARKFKPIK